MLSSCFTYLLITRRYSPGAPPMGPIREFADQVEPLAADSPARTTSQVCDCQKARAREETAANPFPADQSLPKEKITALDSRYTAVIQALDDLVDAVGLKAA